MSERKRLRMGRCLMCLQKKYIVQHNKCADCRINLQMNRYRSRNKLNKFLTKQNQTNSKE